MPNRDDAAPVNLNSSHWDAFEPVVVDGCVIQTRPFAKDPDPSPILRSIPDALYHRSRMAQPAVRTGWLENGPGGADERRGADHVQVSWERALDLVAGEIKLVIAEHGNQAIFAGSYGWGSAGRFHHGRSHMQRLLGALGGFTGSRDSYSNAAGSVLVRNVLGTTQAMDGPGTSWRSIVDHADLVIMFGGVPTRNTQVMHGGVGEHITCCWLEQTRAAGVRFCNISPMRDDAAPFLDARWIAPRPNSDTAIILALTHTLIAEGLYDADFVARYCSGFNAFRAYLLGEVDGVPKSADWAAPLSGISAEQTRALAREMAGSRTFMRANGRLPVRWSGPVSTSSGLAVMSKCPKRPRRMCCSRTSAATRISIRWLRRRGVSRSSRRRSRVMAMPIARDIPRGSSPRNGWAVRKYPLHLLTTQPRTGLHSQTDMGRVSQQSKVAGREPMRINSGDAQARGIRDGDVVRVFNDRGAILAGSTLTDEIRPDVIQISTGAWYDPAEPGQVGSLDKHGNPNVLTLDKGTSRLAQGPSAQTTLVEVERYIGEPPPVGAFEPPIDTTGDSRR
jgi:anaerobic selenocysteine-containing dehydrogenase